MDNCEPLVWYGTFILLATGALVIIPYWLGKTDLVNGWSFLMAGVAMFAGFASYDAAMSPARFPGLDWFNPTQEEVTWFMFTWTAFLVVLVAAYYYDPFSRALAARIMNKWPPISTTGLLFFLLVCLILSVTVLIPPLQNITFVSQVLFNVSHKAFIFGCVFGFLLWYRNPRNLLWLAVFGVVFLFTCYLSIKVSNGRRLVLSVFLAPMCVVYFYSLRNWRPTRTMAIVAVALVGIFVLGLMYNTFRNFSRTKEQKERNYTEIVDQLKKIGDRKWANQFANNKLFALSQQGAHYALLTKRLVDNGTLKPRPLNTLHFLATYPIPRRIWPNKPVQLGHIIVKETGIVRITSTNWGVTVPAHAAFEGGLLAAAIYAYIAAFGVRFLDELLKRQPTNPFLIGILASAAMHILAWPRGDLFNMTAETAEAFLFAAALGILGRIVFGTARVQLPSPFTASHVALNHSAR